jgi:uncharacterized membrane protein YkoI
MSNNPKTFSFSKMIGAGVLCSVLIGAASLAAAYAIVLKARPGRITDEELEKESGGSGLR